MEALGALYDRYAQTLYHTALRFSLSEADARDAVQDVFVGLPTALQKYVERGQFESWVRRITVRRALDVRSERRTQVDGPHRLHSAADPVDVVALARALERVPTKLRDVFLLREREGYSHKEIGEILGIRPGTSAVRLHRAHRILREILK